MSTFPKVTPPKISTAAMQAAAQLLAADHGIDIASLTGSGPNGSLTIEDVSAAIKHKVDVLSSQAGFAKLAADAQRLHREMVPEPNAAAATTRKPAPGPTAVDPSASLSDEEANDCLWRLGVRAGLTPPKGKLQYLANPDGTMWHPKNHSAR